ncbi:hypothetical protein CMV_028108 [Castanea mollissima]|uniref:Cytochrome P450 n=1 Tax=Castanea mollissima TaxID=60419 RepID=A0A8J4QGM3_9ROSI|nr:hypothetical protein CMV_028108 [Castanea mollissima]
MPKNERKLSPGPRPLPINGNLHMLGSFPHHALQSLAQKYTPIMSLRLGHVPTTELFLKTHATVFASRPIFQASKVSGMSKGISFTDYGPYWRSLRELITLQLLSAKNRAICTYEEGGGSIIGASSLKKAAATHEVEDLSEKVCQLIEETICRMVFGQNNDNTFDLKTIMFLTLGHLIYRYVSMFSSKNFKLP